MPDALRAQRLHERLGHVLLPDDVGERLGPVAAVEGGDHIERVVGTGDLGLGVSTGSAPGYA